ncbi:hypothetical protein GGX14DRAFT_701070 [Mycena pura]|uniref:Uncharacterized protein n=1 Tax=Mycena pura TaxID=153505 RepID=A0AAD6UZI3_9AGAR|nr:hypothetical protein GGX14DRAFT_701070 [Mycena pura]
MYGGWHNAQYPSASAPLDASTWATTDPEMGTEIDDSLSAWQTTVSFPPQMGPHALSSAAMPHTMGTFPTPFSDLSVVPTNAPQYPSLPPSMPNAWNSALDIGPTPHPAFYQHPFARSSSSSVSSHMSIAYVLPVRIRVGDLIRRSPELPDHGVYEGNMGFCNEWDEFMSYSSGPTTPFSSSDGVNSNIWDASATGSSSSRLQSVDPSDADPFAGLMSDWGSERLLSPGLEFEDSADPLPTAAAPAPAPPPGTTLPQKRQRKSKKRNTHGPIDPATLDFATLDWLPSNTTWLDVEVTSEYVEFPRGLRVTSHKTIKRLERVHGHPSEFPHFKTPTAFIVSYSKDIVPAGMTPDAYFRDLCPHSWGSGGGSRSKVDAYLSGLFFGREAKELIPCRRPKPKCQGVYACESLDPTFIHEQRRELDPHRQTRLAQATLYAREQQEGTRVGQALTFLRAQNHVHCRGILADGTRCPGRISDVRRRRNAESGDNYGLACTNYGALLLSPDNRHSTQSIPPRINMDILLAAKAGRQICEAEDVEDQCPMVVSLKSMNNATKECDFNHWRDGVQFTASLVRVPCEAEISLYCVLNPDSYPDIALMMLVVPDDTTYHEHPAALGMKCPVTVRELYKSAVRAFGPGATVAKVEMALTTRAMMDRKTPSQYHVSLMNGARKHRLLAQVRAEGASGMSVAEDIAAHIARQQAILDPKKRYIHSSFQRDGARIIFGANSRLLQRIHKLRTLDIDTSFKPVVGKMQMFELNGWLASHARAITPMRVWMEVHDRAAFKLVWSEVFRLVSVLTDCPLRFKRLHYGGTMLGINTDMEAAPILAFGDAAWETMSEDRRRKVGDTAAVPLYTTRVCDVHYNRGIDESCKHLPAGKPSNRDADSDPEYSADESDTEGPPQSLLTRRRLRRLTRFRTQDQLDELERDIFTLADPKVISWWNQKKMHRWLLPGLVQFLSHIDADDWHLMPSSTNLGEGQHHWNNVQTGTSMSIIESMEKYVYEDLDNLVADQLDLGDSTGDLRNMHNNPIDRYASQSSRRVGRAEKARRGRTLEEHVHRCTFAVSEVKARLQDAKISVKSQTSVRAKEAAQGLVRSLEDELAEAKNALVQAKAEVNSNSSGKVRASAHSGAKAPPFPQRPPAAAAALASSSPPPSEHSPAPPVPQSPSRAPSAPGPASAPAQIKPRRSTRKRARSPSPARPAAARPRRALDLNWGVYDEEGNEIPAAEFAKKFPEEWAKRYGRLYDHLLQYIE